MLQARNVVFTDAFNYRVREQEWKFLQSVRLPLLLLLVARLRHVQPQARRVEVHLVAAVLQDLRDGLRVLELTQADVAARLLDGLTDELGRPRLTLRAHNRRLLLLPRLVDDEGRALRLLLGNLLGLDGGGEFGGEGEMLRHVRLR